MGLHSLAFAEIQLDRPTELTEACTPMQAEAGECDCGSRECNRYMSHRTLNQDTRLIKKVGSNTLPDAKPTQGTEHE